MLELVQSAPSVFAQRELLALRISVRRLHSVEERLPLLVDGLLTVDHDGLSPERVPAAKAGRPQQRVLQLEEAGLPVLEPRIVTLALCVSPHADDVIPPCQRAFFQCVWGITHTSCARMRLPAPHCTRANDSTVLPWRGWQGCLGGDVAWVVQVPHF